MQSESPPADWSTDWAKTSSDKVDVELAVVRATGEGNDEVSLGHFAITRTWTIGAKRI